MNTPRRRLRRRLGALLVLVLVVVIFDPTGASPAPFIYTMW